MIYNGREITPEYVAGLLIDGHYFHSDEAKVAILRSILPHEAMLMRFQFLSFIQDATRQILYIDNIIKIAFAEGLFRFE